MENCKGMNECSATIVEVMKSGFEMAPDSGILRRYILGGWLPENFQESRFGSVLRYQKLCCYRKPLPNLKTIRWLAGVVGEETE